MAAAKFISSALYDLTGSIAVVTGGGTGIGLMITHGLAANGAKVYITGRRLGVLQKVADSWDGKGKIIPLQMDVTNKESILEAKKYLVQNEGKVNILVNNAGQVGPTSPFMSDKSRPENKDAETLGNALFQEPLQGWSDIYTVNTFSIFFVTTAFLGLLDNGAKALPGTTSSIINITSISGVIKLAQDHFAYNSAKAAASHLTKMMATEFSLKKIPVRINAIAPGPYLSEMTPQVAPEDVDLIAKGLIGVPTRRPGKEEEMAGTAVYLASPSSGYMNGQELIIDGGFVAVNPSTV